MTPHESAESNPTKPTSRRVLVVLSVATLLFAGGGTFMLVRSFLGRPGDPAELPVAADLPLSVGDRLRLRVDEKSCEVELLAVQADGSVLLVPCASDGVPTTVLRSALRVGVYRRNPRDPRATPGDVLVDPAHRERGRLVLVDASGGSTVCVRRESAPAEPCAAIPRVGLLRLRPAR